MTLPIQTLCGDNKSVPLKRGGLGGGGLTTTTTTTTASTTTSTTASRRGRRRVCLSAAWADPPNIRKERRRAIYSWSVGYGTLTELEESPFKQDLNYNKGGKVADNTTLLEPRDRRLITTLPTIHAPTTTSSSTTTIKQSSPAAPRRSRSRLDLFTMPGIKTLVNRRRNSNSEITQSSPLVNKSNGNASLASTPTITPTTITTNTGNSTGNLIKPAISLASLRKYETVFALTTTTTTTNALRSSSSSSSIEPLQPVNRLRATTTTTKSSLNNELSLSNSKICSRCSSILTLASTSKYSLNSTTGFVPVLLKDAMLLCKLCLVEIPSKDACYLEDCNCAFCADCMKVYVEFEIAQGAYDISCPDAQCPLKGVLREEEIKRLAGSELFEKHKKYRLNREIELDKSRTWCPRAGCETVCKLCPTQQCQPQSVHCPNCTTDFCSNCKLEWHDGLTCDENSKRLAKEGKTEDAGIPFNSDLIKCCPMCNVPIEKDEGCAQMMCKRCKHVFCWYCLASLDDDFLLRHYDKGPCKNKLGHSRASVIWHRTQVIGIFAGFGILLLVASPLLLLAAPCIVCCKCRACNAGTTKLDNDEDPVVVEES